MGDYKSVEEIIQEEFPESKKRMYTLNFDSRRVPIKVIDAKISENDRYIIFVASAAIMEYTNLGHYVRFYQYVTMGVKDKKRRGETYYGIITSERVDSEYLFGNPYNRNRVKERNDLTLSEIIFLEDDKISVSLKKDEKRLFKTYEIDLEKMIKTVDCHPDAYVGTLVEEYT